MVMHRYTVMYVEREIKKRFDKIIKSYNMVAVVGARQAGKTTFLKKQMEHSKSTYILFDDPDVRSLFDEDIKNLNYNILRDMISQSSMRCNPVKMLDEN